MGLAVLQRGDTVLLPDGRRLKDIRLADGVIKEDIEHLPESLILRQGVRIPLDYVQSGRGCLLLGCTAIRTHGGWVVNGTLTVAKGKYCTSTTILAHKDLLTEEAQAWCEQWLRLECEGKMLAVPSCVTSDGVICA